MGGKAHPTREQEQGAWPLQGLRPGLRLPPHGISCPSAQPARTYPQPAPDTPALPAGPALPLGVSGIHPTGVQAHSGGPPPTGADNPRPDLLQPISSGQSALRPSAQGTGGLQPPWVPPLSPAGTGTPTPREQRAAGTAPAPSSRAEGMAPGRGVLWSSAESQSHPPARHLFPEACHLPPWFSTVSSKKPSDPKINLWTSIYPRRAEPSPQPGEWPEPRKGLAARGRLWSTEQSAPAVRAPPPPGEAESSARQPHDVPIPGGPAHVG